jgi:hypothetical protein
MLFIVAATFLSDWSKSFKKLIVGTVLYVFQVSLQERVFFFLDCAELILGLFSEVWDSNSREAVIL